MGGKDLIKPNSSFLRMSLDGFEYCSHCCGLGTGEIFTDARRAMLCNSGGREERTSLNAPVGEGELGICPPSDI
jgi:hypothetical protein